MPKLGKTRRAAVTALLTVATATVAMLPPTAARQATPVASPAAEASTELPPAWLQFGPDGALLARAMAVVECPPIAFDGIEVPMTPRAAATDDFPAIACEATVPFGAASAVIGGQSLPLPNEPIERIAVIGDAGCRLSDWDKKYQACNDPDAWPFARVANSVAARQPDLIVHVGDFLYRESPCPEGNAGCAGSPHGDNWPTWDADFFAPVTPLLGTAPWVFMRGNHETCDRNPEGWFRFLDPRPYQRECQRFTAPYVTTLRGLKLAVIDSAEASDEVVKLDEAAQYARQFDLLAEIAPAESWLVTHRPVWGLLEGNRGETEVQNADYEAATGDSLKGDYALVLSGHIHLAETLAFDDSSGRPPQLVSGNAGTALDEAPSGTPTAAELGDRNLTVAETFSAFGFMTMERDGDAWVAVQRNESGEPVFGCRLHLPDMTCAPVE